MQLTAKMSKFLNTIDPSVKWDQFSISETTDSSKLGVSILGGSVTIKYPKNPEDEDQFILDFEKTSHLLCTPSDEKIAEIRTRILTEKVAFDIETNSLTPFHRGTKIIAFSIAFTNGESYSFPTAAPFASEPVAQAFTELMTYIVKNACYLIIFNGNYDTKYLCHKFPNELEFSKINFKSDPMIDAYLYSGAAHKEDNLAYLAKKYLKAKEWKGGPKDWLENTFSRVKDRTFDKVPVYILLPYARRDSYYTMMLHLFLQDKIDAEGLQSTVNFVKGRVSSICYKMHWDGFWTDKWAMDSLDKRYAAKTAETENILKTILLERIQSLDATVDASAISRELNINSPSQMAIIMYDILGLPVLDRTEQTRKPKTGTNQVLKISTFDPPVFAAFNTYKKWEKNRGYLKNYANFTGQIGGLPDSEERVCAHAEFSVIGTRTGRLASSRPNGQNISVGSGLKSVFCSPDRSLIINALYEELANKGMPTRISEYCRNYTDALMTTEKLLESEIEDEIEDSNEDDE